jgi:DNA-binding IscR family transcriptional regulator
MMELKLALGPCPDHDLPELQSLIFAELWYAGGRIMKSDELAARIGRRAQGVAQAIPFLNANLRTRGVRYRIDSQKGPGGGYRLVKA